MQGTWVIYRRELAGLFLAPLGWVLLFLALFANGLFVYLLLDATRGDVGTVLRSALGGGTLFWALLVFLPPLLAMRMMAEESRTGTLEYLLTARLMPEDYDVEELADALAHGEGGDLGVEVSWGM